MLNQEDQEYQDDNYQDDSYSDEGDQGTVLDPVEDKITKLQEQIAMLQQSLTAKAQPVKSKQAEELELTEEQYAAIAKDPKLLGQFVKAHLQKTTNTIKLEQQKAHYDKVAEERFPALKSNKELANKVAQKMHELVEVTGEYKWDSPTLLLRAAELVVPTQGGILDVNKRRDSNGGHSALDAQTSGAVRNRQGVKSKIQDNDPRIQFAKAFGITDPKKLEEFKSSLGPYQAPQRRKGRSLIK